MERPSANGLNYSLRFTLADSRTKITRYSNPSGLIDSFYEGKYCGEIWGYETIGIARTDDEMAEHVGSLVNGGQSALGQDWQAGDIMYSDLNEDGKIDAGARTLDNHGDLKRIGNSTPRYNVGIDLSADWKGFDFRMFWQGTLKRDYFQGSYYFGEQMAHKDIGSLLLSKAMKIISVMTKAARWESI